MSRSRNLSIKVQQPKSRHYKSLIKSALQKFNQVFMKKGCGAAAVHIRTIIRMAAMKNFADYLINKF